MDIGKPLRIIEVLPKETPVPWEAPKEPEIPEEIPVPAEKPEVENPELVPA
jgi:hypothetical protein